MYSFKDEKGDELFLLKKYVLVEMEQVKEKTAGGLFIPDSVKFVAQGRVDKGVLVCISKEVSASDLPLKIGDTVFVHRFAGIEMEINKKLYKIVESNDIYACLRKGGQNAKPE